MRTSMSKVVRDLAARTRESANSWNDGMRTQASTAAGRTRWGRGLALVVPSTAAVAALSYSLQSGAMAANFNVADQALIASIDSVDGTGLAAVVSSVNAKNADGSSHAVGTLHLAIGHGKLRGVCIIAKQTIKGVGYSIIIKAATTGEGSGQNLIFDATDAKAVNVRAQNLLVGRSADEISLNGQSLGGQAGGLGIDGPDAIVHLENLHATAWSAELLGAIKAADFTTTIKPGEVTTC
ncbi:DUF6230 family protein [Smaragdicoccus niigatensis]|uniref:DUF6230 family protein n=1 Tax=Smaragdicoccus niigatensis TaxID=359359 RepID=UPI001FE12E6F|nr:DUF6230 family protein [Smaragdicoccus niigatensis]